MAYGPKYDLFASFQGTFLFSGEQYKFFIAGMPTVDGGKRCLGMFHVCLFLLDPTNAEEMASINLNSDPKYYRIH